MLFAPMERINHRLHHSITMPVCSRRRGEGGRKVEVLRNHSSLGPVGDGCGDFVNLYLRAARDQPTHQHI